MKFKLAALVAICLIILVGAHFVFKAIPKPSYVDRGAGVVCNPIPRFTNYPTASGSGAVAVPINFTSNTRAAALQADILTATASGINFAQNYMLVEGSCGYSCQNHAIIDSKTGNIVEYGLRTTGGVSFRADSSLLIVNPTGKNTTRYYNLKDGVLQYLCEK